MIPLFKVTKAGVYSSIQDKGRFGYRRFGVPVSGPMDFYAFRYGNYIFGNPPNSTGLEIFLGGVELEVLSDHRIVITGANLEPRVDGRPILIWKSFNLYRGQVLTFSHPKNGSIAYVIPEGGFRAKEMLGSASVYPRGYLGNLIEKNQILYARKEKTNTPQRGLIKSEIPDYPMNLTVKVWPSPHLDKFVLESIEEFLQSTYTFRNGDRMGYLLHGDPLRFLNGSDILSEATQFGTIQVPNSGQPIILMADAQTIGGYATIGKIAEDDLWKVAQLRPKGTLQFSFIE